MKLYIKFDAIPGIWEYSNDNESNNITNEIVKKNICEHLAPMTNTSDQGQIARMIANDHHFKNSITRKEVLQLPWGSGPSGCGGAPSHHGHPQGQGAAPGYGGQRPLSLMPRSASSCLRVRMNSNNQSHYTGPPSGYGAPPPGYGGQRPLFLDASISFLMLLCASSVAQLRMCSASAGLSRIQYHSWFW
jgi:hypothetical protein